MRLKNRTIGAFLILSGLASAPVFAGPAGSSYVGLQYAQLDYEAEVEYYQYDLDLETEPDALVGRIGYLFTDYFALEARLGMGLSDDDIELEGHKTGVTTEVDYMYGIYGVGHLPFTDMFSLYALLGYTGIESKFEADAISMSDETTDSDFSYGIGAQVNFTPTLGGTLEYISYLDMSEDYYDFKLNALSAGLSFRF